MSEALCKEDRSTVLCEFMHDLADRIMQVQALMEKNPTPQIQKDFDQLYSQYQKAMRNVQINVGMDLLHTSQSKRLLGMRL